MEITQKLLKELFNYREDGYLIRKTSAGGNKIGTVAGTPNGEGYWYVGVKGKDYRVHRLIYFWFYGILPETIDHHDRVISNNRIDNLRAATNQQSSRNRSSRKGSSSQYLGVCRDGRKWRVRIYIKGKVIKLGYFINEEDAARAYDEAAKELFGEFANLNFK